MADRLPCQEVSSPALTVLKLRLEARGGVQSRVTNDVICSFSKYVLRALFRELEEMAVNKRQNPVLVGLRVRDERVVGRATETGGFHVYELPVKFFAYAISLIFRSLKPKETVAQ